MEKIEVSLYKFNELNDNAKKTAIKWYREGNDYPFLSEDLKNELEYQLNELKISYDNLKVFYDLSYSQGDFFLFEGTINYNNLTYIIKVSSGLYNKLSIDILDEYSQELLGDSYSKAYNDFIETYKQLCRDMKKYGYAEIDYQDKDESIIENIECNEYTFLANGKRANKEDFY